MVDVLRRCFTDLGMKEIEWPEDELARLRVIDGVNSENVLTVTYAEVR